MTIAHPKKAPLRQQLYRLVDSLPDQEIGAAHRYLEFLGTMGSDPVYRALMNAVIDDEPETPEEIAAMRMARKQMKQGEVFPWDEVKKGLKNKR